MNSPVKSPGISMSRWIYAILGWLVFCSSGMASIRGYTDATNNRFTNSNSFVMATFDLSGVGKEPDVTFQPNESSRWATAISRNVVMSAYHARPSGPVHFHVDNDPNKSPVVRSVVEGQRVGSTDLWIGVLDAPLPPSIRHYDYAQEALSGVDGELEDAGTFQDLNAYLFSQIRRANDPQQDQRVGRNKVSGYIENIDFLNLTDNDSILFEFDPVGHEDEVTHETRFISHDSGGPTFVEVNGELVLLGINSFTYTTDEGGSGSGITYVGNQTAVIQQYVLDHFVSTPEPGSAALFAVGLGFLLARRRNV